jgi:hypothetical protein
MHDYVGVFRGRKTIQRSATIGGARSVFVKLQGNKNELVYPTFGGYIMNAPKGAPFKFFAGDLVEYRTDENGVNPEIYILKTFLVESVSGTTVNIVKDGFKHIPHVGDKIGVAPDEIGGEMTAVTITAVKPSKVGSVDVWAVTTNTALTTKKDDVLVEADANGDMMVKHINAVCPTDLDMFDAAATGDEDFDGARYSYTPTLCGLMYTNKMSPLPACVKKINQAKVNGWFQIQSV